MITRMKRQFPLEGNAAFLQLQLKAFLITVLVEPCPQFLMYFMDGTHYVINMLFIC